MPPIPSSNKYFVIPFESVPANPPYTVWYATWSRDRPELGPGMSPPLVVGVTSEARLPAGAVSLGATKDPAPPPPPPPPTFRAEDYKTAFGKWQTYRRDQDE